MLRSRCQRLKPILLRCPELLCTLRVKKLLAPSSWTLTEYGIARHYKSAPLQECKMIDRRRIHVKGGDGGEGCTSFRRSRQSRFGEADGGRGGKGGDVIFKCSLDVWDFGHLQYHLIGMKGGPGSSKKRIGSRGQDKVLQVPVGTVIHLINGEIPSLAQEGCRYFEEDIEFVNQEFQDPTYATEELEELSSITDGSEYTEMEDESVTIISGDETEDEESCDSFRSETDDENMEDSELLNGHSQHDLNQVTQMSVAELVKPGETLLVASGGEGGRGNASMPRGRGANKKLPSRNHEYGRSGTEAYLVLELKTIADVGLVGAPNAGKSTLLGAISRAKPKVGHYAFTTLRPNLGKLEFEDFFAMTVADIPGLIKGAHCNVGLGHDFLRHIERTKALAYVVDLSACLNGNKGAPPWEQVEELKYELEKYQPGLSTRPSLVVATKLDEKGAKEQLRELRRRLPMEQIVPVCALLEQGIPELRQALRDLVCPF